MVVWSVGCVVQKILFWYLSLGTGACLGAGPVENKPLKNVLVVIDLILSASMWNCDSLSQGGCHVCQTASPDVEFQSFKTVAYLGLSFAW